MTSYAGTSAVMRAVMRLSSAQSSSGTSAVINLQKGQSLLQVFVPIA